MCLKVRKKVNVSPMIYFGSSIHMKNFAKACFPPNYPFLDFLRFKFGQKM